TKMPTAPSNRWYFQLPCTGSQAQRAVAGAGTGEISIGAFAVLGGPSIRCFDRRCALLGERRDLLVDRPEDALAVAALHLDADGVAVLHVLRHHPHRDEGPRRP